MKTKITVEYNDEKESITILKINEVNLIHELLEKEIKITKNKRRKKKLIWIDNQFDYTNY